MASNTPEPLESMPVKLGVLFKGGVLSFALFDTTVDTTKVDENGVKKPYKEDGLEWFFNQLLKNPDFARLATSSHMGSNDQCVIRTGRHHISNKVPGSLLVATSWLPKEPKTIRCIVPTIYIASTDDPSVRSTVDLRTAIWDQCDRMRQTMQQSNSSSTASVLLMVLMKHGAYGPFKNLPPQTDTAFWPETVDDTAMRSYLGGLPKDLEINYEIVSTTGSRAVTGSTTIAMVDNPEAGEWINNLSCISGEVAEAATRDQMEESDVCAIVSGFELIKDETSQIVNVPRTLIVSKYLGAEAPNEVHCIKPTMYLEIIGSTEPRQEIPLDTKLWHRCANELRHLDMDPKTLFKEAYIRLIVKMHYAGVECHEQLLLRIPVKTCLPQDATSVAAEIESSFRAEILAESDKTQPFESNPSVSPATGMASQPEEDSIMPAADPAAMASLESAPTLRNRFGMDDTPMTTGTDATNTIGPTSTMDIKSVAGTGGAALDAATPTPTALHPAKTTTRLKTLPPKASSEKTSVSAFQANLTENYLGHSETADAMEGASGKQKAASTHARGMTELMGAAISTETSAAGQPTRALDDRMALPSAGAKSISIGVNSNASAHGTAMSRENWAPTLRKETGMKETSLPPPFTRSAQAEHLRKWSEDITPPAPTSVSAGRRANRSGVRAVTTCRSPEPDEDTRNAFARGATGVTRWGLNWLDGTELEDTPPTTTGTIPSHFLKIDSLMVDYTVVSADGHVFTGTTVLHKYEEVLIASRWINKHLTGNEKNLIAATYDQMQETDMCAMDLGYDQMDETEKIAIKMGLKIKFFSRTVLVSKHSGDNAPCEIPCIQAKLYLEYIGKPNTCQEIPLSENLWKYCTDELRNEPREKLSSPIIRLVVKMNSVGMVSRDSMLCRLPDKINWPENSSTVAEEVWPSRIENSADRVMIDRLGSSPSASPAADMASEPEEATNAIAANTVATAFLESASTLRNEFEMADTSPPPATMGMDATSTLGRTMDFKSMGHQPPPQAVAASILPPHITIPAASNQRPALGPSSTAVFHEDTNNMEREAVNDDSLTTPRLAVVFKGFDSPASSPNPVAPLRSILKKKSRYSSAPPPIIAALFHANMEEVDASVLPDPEQMDVAFMRDGSLYPNKTGRDMAGEKAAIYNAANNHMKRVNSTLYVSQVKKDGGRFMQQGKDGMFKVIDDDGKAKEKLQVAFRSLKTTHDDGQCSTIKATRSASKSTVNKSKSAVSKAAKGTASKAAKGTASKAAKGTASKAAKGTASRSKSAVSKAAKSSTSMVTRSKSKK